MVNEGVAEQDIREELSKGGKMMTSVEFAQQLKMAMVESGEIKQSKSTRPAADRRSTYEVTPKGRLTISNLSDEPGFKPGDRFTLEKPRGRSNAWRLVPVK
jgi:hypothetical protein